MTEFKQITQGLAGIVGEEHVKSDPDTAAKYAVDNRTPKAVAFPKNTRQVSELVTYASRENVSILPWGSGTKMTMGYPPKRLELVISTSRMNHMLDVDTANLTITAEAGVKFRDVQARLATEEDRCYLPLENLTTEADEFICSDRSNSGCFLPLDPPFSEKATIGGILATNSNGPRRLLYGLPRDLVLGVRFVTPDGTIVGAGGKTVKNVSGYDISKLMIGSFGTLGIICEMTLRLLPLPERVDTLLIPFDSYEGATGFADAIFETKLLPAAVEILNRAAFESLPFKGSEGFTPGPYVAVIAIEGFEEAVGRMQKDMVKIAESRGAKGYATIKENEHRLFWLGTSNLQPAVASRHSNLITCRLNYPISEWKEVVRFTDETLSQSGIEHAIVCHSGYGACSISLFTDGLGNGTLGKAAQVIEAILGRCREAGGNMVVETAPAQIKGDLKMWGEPGEDLLIMRRVKEQLDPSGLMSPGRFVGAL